MNQKSVNLIIVIALFLLVTPFVSASFATYAFDSIETLYDSFYGWLDFFILYLIFTSGIQLFLPKEWEEKKGSSGLVLGLGLAMALGLTTWAHFNNFRLMDLGPFILIAVILGLLIRGYKFFTGGEKEKKLSLPLLLIGLIILILLLGMLVPGFIDSIPYLREGLGILAVLAGLGLFLWLLSKLFKKGDKGEESGKGGKGGPSGSTGSGASGRPSGSGTPSGTRPTTPIRCWIELKKNRFNITEKIDIQGKAIGGSGKYFFTWTLYKKRFIDKKIAYQEGVEKLEIFPSFLESFQPEKDATYEVILLVLDQTDKTLRAETKQKFVVFRTAAPTPGPSPSPTPSPTPTPTPGKLKCNIILPKKKFTITEKIDVDSTVTGGTAPYSYLWRIYQKNTGIDKLIEEIPGVDKLNLLPNYFDPHQSSTTKKYEMILIVTDAAGKTDTTKEIIEVTKTTGPTPPGALACEIILDKNVFALGENITAKANVINATTAVSEYVWVVTKIGKMGIVYHTGGPGATDKLTIPSSRLDRSPAEYKIDLSVTNDSKTATDTKTFKVTTTGSSGATVKIKSITVGKNSTNTTTDDTYAVDSNSKIYIRVAYENPKKVAKVIAMNYTTKGRTKPAIDSITADEGNKEVSFSLKIENERGYKGELIFALFDKSNTNLAQDRIFLLVEHPTMKGKVKIIGQLEKVGTNISSPHKIKSGEKIKFKATIK